MSVVDQEGLTLWISEQLDLPRDVVEGVLALEFEYMGGVGIIDLPEYEPQLFHPDELHPAGIVDVDKLAEAAEPKIGVLRDVAKAILEKETDFLRMRGLVSGGSPA